MDEKELMSFKPSNASEIKLYFFAILCILLVVTIPIAIILLLIIWGRVSSTRYRITDQRLFKVSGLISKHEEEIELFRIKDVKMQQNVIQRLWGIGDITVISSDETSPILEINGVRDPENVKETLRAAYRDARKSEGVNNAEFIS